MIEMIRISKMQCYPSQPDASWTRICNIPLNTLLQPYPSRPLQEPKNHICKIRGINTSPGRNPTIMKEIRTTMSRKKHGLEDGAHWWDWKNPTSSARSTIVLRMAILLHHVCSWQHRMIHAKNCPNMKMSIRSMTIYIKGTKIKCQ